jgi:hypothetical protein
MKNTVVFFIDFLFKIYVQLSLHLNTDIFNNKGALRCSSLNHVEWKCKQDGTKGNPRETKNNRSRNQGKR